jgi:hypothetical protein
MGNAYTTQQKVLDEGLKDVPNSSKALIPGWIEDSSRIVDTALARVYRVPFRDITASPGTPSLIEQIARYLTVDRLLRKLGLLRYDENNRLVDSYEQKAWDLLDKLKSGELAIPADQLPGEPLPVVMPGATSQRPPKVFHEGAFREW